MTRPSMVVLSLLALCMAARAADAPDPAWSKPANGLAARLTVTPDRIARHTLLLSTRIAFQNRADMPLTLPWPKAQLHFWIEDQHGNVLPSSHGIYDGEFDIPKDLQLPRDAELAFTITGHGAGLGPNDQVLLDINAQNHWSVPRDNNTYFLRGTLSVPRENALRPFPAWCGQITLPPVEIPTRAPALDPAHAAERIAALGAELFSPHTDPERVEAQLSLISDIRVIPWYIRALEARRATTQSTDRLTGFLDTAIRDAALHKTPLKDGDTELSSLSVISDARLPVAATIALAASADPEARGALFTLTDSQTADVRRIVLTAAQNATDAPSLDVLRQLSHDPNDAIRYAAQDALDARALPPTAPAK
jgi:hypothetical protein